MQEENAKKTEEIEELKRHLQEASEMKAVGGSQGRYRYPVLMEVCMKVLGIVVVIWHRTHGLCLPSGEITDAFQ